MKKDKEHAIDALSRNDLEILLGYQTERLTASQEAFRKEMLSGFRNVSESIEDVDTRFDRLERNTHDDITTLFQELYKLKKYVGMSTKVQE